MILSLLIFSTRFCKNVVEAKQVKNTIVVLPFFDLRKAQLPTTRITEQSTLLTKSKINHLCYKIFKYFC